nr:hypothetical protein [Tanacetum cinerariifolium]
VNTTRSDDDRLKVMELMVFLMQNGVCDAFELNPARLSKFLLSGKCVVCLPNEEIFTGLALVRNVDSNSKFYMVGKGFSGVETPFFKNILVVRDVDAEEEVQVFAQGEDIQENAKEEVATDVVPPTPTLPLPSSPVIPSTPPHQSPCPPQPQDAEGSSHVFQQVLDICSALVLRVEGLENANAAQQLEI